MPAADILTLSGPFRFAPQCADPLRRALIAAARPAVERLLALPTLNALHAARRVMETSRSVPARCASCR